MSNTSKVIHIDFVEKKVIEPPPDEVEIDRIVQAGFDAYLKDYDGQPLTMALLANLCKKVILDCLKVMNENKRNSI